MKFTLFRRTPKFDDLDYDQCMKMLRMLAYGGHDDRRAMRRLALRAVATAPADKKFHAERWAETFKRGHRFGVSTFAVKFYTGGETAALDDEIADALKDVDVPPGFKGEE